MSSTSSSSNAQMGLKTFECENGIQEVLDHRWKPFDENADEALYKRSPWRANPYFFQKVRISATALIKMVTHTRSGGEIEVMGLMQGRATESGEFIILDAFPLPVEGTETQVNPGAGAYEFMCTYKESSEQAGKKENICGWYHSHPGYRPWLSGIDVQTQRLYQQHQEPFVAVVIDPIRTCTTGKVDIGAFRTLPPQTSADGNNSSLNLTKQGAIRKNTATVGVPSEKVADFGVHANEYYPITIEYFKSSMDVELLNTLWNRYWIDTLSQNPLTAGKNHVTKSFQDCTQKLISICGCRREAFGLTSSSSSSSDCPPAISSNGQSQQNQNILQQQTPQLFFGTGIGSSGRDGGAPNSELRTIAEDADNCSMDLLQGIATQMVKYELFGKKSSDSNSSFSNNLSNLDDAMQVG